MEQPIKSDGQKTTHYCGHAPDERRKDYRPSSLFPQSARVVPNADGAQNMEQSRHQESGQGDHRSELAQTQRIIVHRIISLSTPTAWKRMNGHSCLRFLSSG